MRYTPARETLWPSWASIFFSQAWDDQHGALSSASQCRVQRRRFGLQGAFGTIAQFGFFAPRGAQPAGAGTKIGMQGAGGAPGAAQHQGRLRQTQSSLQRQQHGQHDAQFSGRVRLIARFPGCFDTALSCERAGYSCSLIESNIIVNFIGKWNQQGGGLVFYKLRSRGAGHVHILREEGRGAKMQAIVKCRLRWR